MAQIILLLTRRDTAFLTVHRRKAFEDYFLRTMKAKVYFLAMKIKQNIFHFFQLRF